MKPVGAGDRKDSLPDSLKDLPPMKLPPGYKYLDDYLEDHWEDSLIEGARRAVEELQLPPAEP